MKNVIILLTIIMIMLHTQFAVAYYFDGLWFVVPTIVSISLVMLVHLFFLINSVYLLVVNSVKEGRKNA